MKTFSRGFLSRPLALAVLLVSIRTTAAAQSAPASPSAAVALRPLSVGFLPEGSDIINAPILMERLRRDLLARPKVVHALADAGFSSDDIALSPCDGPRDMVQRMSSNEFDMVFATAVVFARQTGDYGDPILMSSLPGDIKPARDGAPVLRFGVVIAGPSSPLFQSKSAIDPAALKAALAASPMAVPSSDSAAGFIYPLIKLGQDYGLAAPAQYYFCDTDAEVVKNVVAGLAPFGACRRGELDALLPKGAEGKYYRILFPTDLFPTDPIVLRKTLAPERSPLGVELKVALRDFFKRPADSTTPGLVFENAAARSYEKIIADLKLFDSSRLRSEPSAPRIPAAAAPPPVPTAQPAPLSAAPVLPPSAKPEPAPAATPSAAPAMPAAKPASTPAAAPAPVRPALPGMIGAGQ